ncbi:MAG TPA: FAD:protein FMN transferase [Candidatus Peribacteraceae bacterium]|nr:FAD:protein FMN transferase [Candidatus Peribacteraceae bacterium]
MKHTQILMGMTITVEVIDPSVTTDAIGDVFDYFRYVDEKFSTYKDTSEITRINEGEIPAGDESDDMKTVLSLCESTKHLTNGYFDIRTPANTLDPSGLVKGWAIWNAAKLLKKRGYQNFYIDAGGDIQTYGMNADGQPWRIGIRNPFNIGENVKIVTLAGDRGMATSGIYARGQHIYNPHDPVSRIDDIVSLTVIGPNVFEADRFATAAFAMGRNGIAFIEKLEGCEGYMIDSNGIAIFTPGFEQYSTVYA